MSSPEIRVVLISAEPEGHSVTEPTRELEAIRTAVSGGTVKVVRESIYHATRESVMSAIDEHLPQMVHWHSHGARDGVFIEGPDGASTRVEAKWLLDVIGACRRTRLVVLSACESIHLAEALATSPNTAVLAAVAWTIRVPNTHVRSFSGAFYRRIARGHGVLAAFEFARRTLETNLQDKVKLVQRAKGTEFLLYEPPAAPPVVPTPPPRQPPSPEPQTPGSPVLRLRVLVGLLLLGFTALALYTYGTWLAAKQDAEEQAAKDQAAAEKAAAEKAAKEQDAAKLAAAKKTAAEQDAAKKAAAKKAAAEKAAAEKPELDVEATIRPKLGPCPVNRACPTMSELIAGLRTGLKLAVNRCPGEPPGERTTLSMKWTNGRAEPVIVIPNGPVQPNEFVRCVATKMKISMDAVLTSATIEFSVEPM